MLGWLDDALCKGKHQDIWFPPFSDERSVPEHVYYDVAKMVCEHCPVRAECLSIGMTEDWGVWGGTTPKEREDPSLYKDSEFKLIPRYVDKVPNHAPGRIDINETRNLLKRYADKR